MYNSNTDAHRNDILSFKTKRYNTIYPLTDESTKKKRHHLNQMLATKHDSRVSNSNEEFFNKTCNVDFTSKPSTFFEEIDVTGRINQSLEYLVKSGKIPKDVSGKVHHHHFRDYCKVSSPSYGDGVRTLTRISPLKYEMEKNRCLKTEAKNLEFLPSREQYFNPDTFAQLRPTKHSSSPATASTRVSVLRKHFELRGPSVTHSPPPPRPPRNETSYRLEQDFNLRHIQNCGKYNPSWGGVSESEGALDVPYKTNDFEGSLRSTSLVGGRVGKLPLPSRIASKLKTLGCQQPSDNIDKRASVLNSESLVHADLKSMKTCITTI